ncbi:TPA: hypothetical protein ACHJT8_004637, partial [Escherichia coli]
HVIHIIACCHGVSGGGGSNSLVRPKFPNKTNLLRLVFLYLQFADGELMVKHLTIPPSLFSAILSVGNVGMNTLLPAAVRSCIWRDCGIC